MRVLYITRVSTKIPTIGDARTYHLLARGLATGHGYVRPDQLAAGHQVPTAEFPPLFPFVLSVLARLGLRSIESQKIAMAVVGSLTVVVIGLVAERVAGPRTGLIAAAAAAFYLPLIELDASLMPETITALLAVGCVFVVLVLRSRPAPLLWLAAGGLVGLATLTRGELALLMPALFGPALWRAARTRRRRLESAALMIAGAVAVVGPWMIRNAVVLDHPVVLSNNLGGLVLGANCPATYYERPGLWLFSCYRRVDITGLDETERSAAFLDQGLTYARHHAGRVPAIMAIRLGRTWGVWAVNDQINIETFEGRDHFWHTVAHRMHLGAVVLAVGGLFVLRRRRAVVWPLLAIGGLVSIMTMVTYGNQRFRAPADPAVLVFAAAYLAAGVARVRPQASR